MQEGIEVAETRIKREWTPAPPTHLPPGWGRDHCPAGRPGGREGQGEGRAGGPESRFQGAPTYCAASRG